MRTWSEVLHPQQEEPEALSEVTEISTTLSPPEVSKTYNQSLSGIG